eukprot:8466830-Pyramimonas_sp.AAC.1
MALGVLVSARLEAHEINAWASARDLSLARPLEGRVRAAIRQGNNTQGRHQAIIAFVCKTFWAQDNV